MLEEVTLTGAFWQQPASSTERKLSKAAKAKQVSVLCCAQSLASRSRSWLRQCSLAQAAAALAELPPLPRVHRINVVDVPLTRAPLPVLAALFAAAPALETVELESLGVSAARLLTRLAPPSLQVLLPNCVVLQSLARV